MSIDNDKQNTKINWDEIDFSELELEFTKTDEFEYTRDENGRYLAKQPRNMPFTLYPHQLHAIYMMENREKNRNIPFLDENDDIAGEIESDVGIYADMTGYGKTSAIIGLLVRDQMKWDISTPFKYIWNDNSYGMGRIKLKRKTEYTKMKSNIILASPSIINQWVTEIGKSLTYCVIKKRKDIENIKDIANIYDIIIVTVSMFNDFVKQFEKNAWKRFIFDEAPSTHVKTMPQIKAGYYWLITATPRMFSKTFGLRKSFLGSIFNTGNTYHTLSDSAYKWDSHSDFHEYEWERSPDTDQIFNSLIIKNDDDFIKQSFQLPETIHINYECYQPIYNIVNEFITPEISDMISAGDISGAVQALGGKTSSNIIDLIQQKNKEDKVKAENSILLYRNRGVGYEYQVETWTNKLNQINERIKNLNERFENALDGECCITREKLVEPVMLSCCQNIFSGQALLSWLDSEYGNNTCPMCRENVQEENIIHITNESTVDQKVEEHIYERKKTKPEIIIDIINEDRSKKFIIFSSWDGTWDVIKRLFNDNDIEYTEILGHQSTREKNISKFKNGEINVLFLNSRYNGAGINLQETTDIILYHEMNESLTTQILGRANRIGRTETLTVHHLI